VFATRPVLGKEKSNTAWPILLTNYNITSEIRTHIDNLFPVAVIPGAAGAGSKLDRNKKPGDRENA
jgi:hypothetical protein